MGCKLGQFAIPRYHPRRTIFGTPRNARLALLAPQPRHITDQDGRISIAELYEIECREGRPAKISEATPDSRFTASDDLQCPTPEQRRLGAGGSPRQLIEHRAQRTIPIRFADPIALLCNAWPQTMIRAPVYIDHFHVLFNRFDRREETLSIEAVEVQLVGRLIGRGHNHHAFIEHHPEQPAKNDCVANVTDEQLIETQHPHLFTQLFRQGTQRIGSAVELEKSDMHPAHEVMEVLPPGRNAQAVMEHIH